MRSQVPLIDWGLRDYGVAGQLGLERTPEDHVAKLVAVVREVRRVLRDDGTLWLNLGDSYASDTKGDNRTNTHLSRPQHGFHGGQKRHNNLQPRKITHGLKPKDLVGIPWRVAFALQADGWYLRSDIIWAKKNCMPESIKDRPTRSHEYIFLLAKSERYYYDYEAIMEPGTFIGPNAPSKSPHAQNLHRIARKNKQRGHSRRHAGFNERWDSMTREEQCSVLRNKRDVWQVATHPFPEAHFATFPPDLIEPCILAGCPAGGTVLDPFFGAGTTGLVAKKLGREFIGIELNPAYVEMAKRRIYGPLMMAAESLPSE